MKDKLNQGIVASLCALTLVASGCQPQAQIPTTHAKTTPAKQAKVAVGVVRSQLLEQTIQLPATVESDETAMLMARVESYVTEVLVDIGDEVEEGQMLVQLSAPELKHAVKQQQAMLYRLDADEQVLAAKLRAAHTHLDSAHAELALKESERDRFARLVSTGAIDRQRLEEAESAAQSTAAMLARYGNEVQVAEANLEKGKSEIAIAKARLEGATTLAGYLQIKAPFTGLVASRNVDPGNLVRPASSDKDTNSLLTIIKVDKLQAVVHATVDIAGQLNVGDPAIFVADDLPEHPFEGELSRTSGTYDPKTRMMRAEIELDNSAVTETGRRPLRSGSYGSVEIMIQSAVLPVVPESALLQNARGTSIVVVRDGLCMITPVKVAMKSDGLVGIAEGLSAGDHIVAEKADSVHENQKLEESQIKIIAW
ncbi:MAG: efflux RND transporter periplasmic adaptor subunit [Pirellulales bacterium]